jgi:cytochrome c oxidase subunit 3
MAATTKNHPYHILPPSLWPFAGSMASLLLTGGGVMWMHDNPYGVFICIAGLIGVLAVAYSWWRDVVHESRAGDHTPIVQLHLRYGMILFIASEVMFFVAWFWAWFSNALFPSAVDSIGAQWPPKGMEVLDPFSFPLLNTLILLCSGTTVTWAHHSLINGDRKGLKLGLLLTIGLGLIFTCVQAYEYIHAPFSFSLANATEENPANVYTSAFFMATGFHGVHVIIGTIFLIVCYFRAVKGDFTPQKHFGFEAAAWYWHFVDVVWLFLFVSIYIWGGWGAPTHG